MRLGIKRATTPKSLLLVCSLCFLQASQAFLPPTTASPAPSSSRNQQPLTVMRGSALLDAMSKGIADATKSDKVSLKFSEGGGIGGGGGASVGAVTDTVTGTKYFYKSTGMYGYDMLRAEYKGVKAMHDTQTIRVPRPICVGTQDSTAFVVFEYLPMGGTRGGETGYAMGKRLAQMHRSTSGNGQYGWDINNTIGATLQVNPWTPTWADFWDEHRLGHMLRLCKRDGASFPKEAELRKKVHSILSAHNPPPSLVHGDLWSGNAGVTADNEPTIFDPAVYYGDREVDIAMTYLFGSFPESFHKGYNDEWPLPPGHEKRKVIYNLYHILNHFVLFGGGYLSQAQRMIDQILKMEG